MTELSAVNSCVSRAWPTSRGVRSDRFQEIVEEGPSVVGTGCGLRVVLHPKDGLGSMAQALDGSIVQIHVRHLKLGCAGDLRFVARNGAPVILRRDQHPVRVELFHR